MPGTDRQCPPAAQGHLVAPQAPHGDRAEAPRATASAADPRPEAGSRARTADAGDAPDKGRASDADASDPGVDQTSEGADQGSDLRRIQKGQAQAARATGPGTASAGTFGPGRRAGEDRGTALWPGPVERAAELPGGDGRDGAASRRLGEGRRILRRFPRNRAIGQAGGLSERHGVLGQCPAERRCGIRAPDLPGRAGQSNRR
jgi:hypothetical protein